jgi:hypothetical protein
VEPVEAGALAPALYDDAAVFRIERARWSQAFAGNRMGLSAASTAMGLSDSSIV